MEPSPAASESHRPSLWPLLIIPVLLAGLWAWLLATAAPRDQGGVVRSGWLEDYDLASTKARESGRPVLVNFTGSDWCGYCIQMREEIFDTGIFAAWAKEHVVLLECDFPRTHQLPMAVTTQNNRLADLYGITSFPTVMLLNGEGRELARLGYQRGGAARWIATLHTLQQDMRRGHESPEDVKSER